MDVKRIKNEIDKVASLIGGQPFNEKDAIELLKMTMKNCWGNACDIKICSMCVYREALHWWYTFYLLIYNWVQEGTLEERAYDVLHEIECAEIESLSGKLVFTEEEKRKIRTEMAVYGYSKLDLDGEFMTTFLNTCLLGMVQIIYGFAEDIEQCDEIAKHIASKYSSVRVTKREDTIIILME